MTEREAWELYSHFIRTALLCAALAVAFAVVGAVVHQLGAVLMIPVGVFALAGAGAGLWVGRNQLAARFEALRRKEYNASR